MNNTFFTQNNQISLPPELANGNFISLEQGAGININDYYRLVMIVYNALKANLNISPEEIANYISLQIGGEWYVIIKDAKVPFPIAYYSLDNNFSIKFIIGNFLFEITKI